MSTVSSRQARLLVEAALDAAAIKGVTISAVVVDRPGTIVAAGRSDGAVPYTLELARRKAALSAAMGVASHLVVTMARTDPVLEAGLRSMEEYLALPGAVPLLGPGGVAEGALGVAGGHYAVDQEIAEDVVKH